MIFRQENTRFVEVLRQLEASPICQSLAMHSFLMLPMQRITRLPLLVEAIFNRLNANSTEYEPCKKALETLNKVRNNFLLTPQKNEVYSPWLGVTRSKELEV